MRDTRDTIKRSGLCGILRTETGAGAVVEGMAETYKIHERNQVTYSRTPGGICFKRRSSHKKTATKKKKRKKKEPKANSKICCRIRFYVFKNNDPQLWFYRPELTDYQKEVSVYMFVPRCQRKLDLGSVESILIRTAVIEETGTKWN